MPPVAGASAVCARSGCGKPTWNGQQGEYCSFSCRLFNLALPKYGAPSCARSGCGKPTWNLQPGEYCSKTCRDLENDDVDAADWPTCARNGCGNATYNGLEGEFCSRGCRDANLANAATLPKVRGPKCANKGCQQPSWNGVDGEFCSKKCKAANHQAFCTVASSNEYNDVAAQFQAKWRTGSVPPIRAIYKIHACNSVVVSYQRKCSAIGNVPLKDKNFSRSPGNQNRRFHGTKMACSFVNGTPCASSGCSACSIIREGFKIKHLSKNTGNRGFFGPGHYTSSTSSTAKGYGNCVIVANVAVGLAEIVQNNTSAPLGGNCHSRVANKTTGNDELMVPSDDQLLPLYIILF